MTNKRQPSPAPHTPPPLGAEVARPRWVLGLWLLLLAAWLLFLVTLVLRERYGA